MDETTDYLPRHAEGYGRLTTSVAFISNPDLALIAVEGPDALGYLHRRLSQSLIDLPDGQGTHALQLGGDGKIQADLLIYRLGQRLFVLVKKKFADEAFALMDRFILMDNLTVSRLWDDFSVVGLAGPRAPAVLNRWAKVDPKTTWSAFGPLDIAGHECRIFRDGRWSAPHFNLCVAGDHLSAFSNNLLQACESEGGGPADPDALDFLRIEQGIPEFGIDTGADTIPLEAGLADAIHFDKGCFPGQEVLARIRNLGHPARLMVRLEIMDDSRLEPGASILSGDQKVGSITSSRSVAGLDRTVALGYLKWRFGQLETVRIDSATGRVTAVVRPLPERNSPDARQFLE